MCKGRFRFYNIGSRKSNSTNFESNLIDIIYQTNVKHSNTFFSILYNPMHKLNIFIIDFKRDSYACYKRINDIFILSIYTKIHISIFFIRSQWKSNIMFSNRLSTHRGGGPTSKYDDNVQLRFIISRVKHKVWIILLFRCDGWTCPKAVWVH